MEQSELGYWICASFQHLRAFSLQAENIDEFETTLMIGELAQLLNAVRGRGTVNARELERITKGQRIGAKSLKSNLLPTLQKLNHERARVVTSNDKFVYLEEHLDSAVQLYQIVGKAWEMLEPSLIERGAIYILQHTFLAPRTQTEELNLLNKNGLADEDAESTVGVTTSFRIVQSFEGKGLDEPVLFNPYIWRSNQAKIAHAITHLPSNGATRSIRHWKPFRNGRRFRLQD